MKYWPLVKVTVACLVLTANADAANDLTILEEFAKDFASDAFLQQPMVFGVKVDDSIYTVNAKPADDSGPAVVTVTAAEPELPTFYFSIESSIYLKQLDEGKFNSLTLMAKAFSTDETPMDIEVQDGFQPSEDFLSLVIPLSFHFWNRGTPEVIHFGRDNTRVTHGTNVGVFYYQPGFRSGWFDIRPGQHVNENPDSRLNPFPSMFIMIEGEVNALIGEQDILFKAGEMMFVPTDVSHQFINRGEQPAFGFLFSFGEGA